MPLVVKGFCSGVRSLPAQIEKFFHDSMVNESFPAGILCADGELGVALKKALMEHVKNNITIVSIDDPSAARDLSLSVYAQPFDELAQEVYQCLLEQNQRADQ